MSVRFPNHSPQNPDPDADVVDILRIVFPIIIIIIIITQRQTRILYRLQPWIPISNPMP